MTTALVGAVPATGTAPHATAPGVVERRAVEPLAVSAGQVVRCSMTALADGIDDDAAVETGSLHTALLRLDPGQWTAHWFVSDWGDEFTPRSAPVSDGARWAVTTGRSSKGTHPWVLFERSGGSAVIVAPAWSGNWMVGASVGADGRIDVVAGISDWKFSRRLSSSRPFRAPEVYVASGADRWQAAAALAEAVGRYVVPSNAWTDSVPAAWNHWWPYEDAEIDEATFLDNAAVADSLGLDVSTLDAGWFGVADATSFWEKVRGDWHLENTERFPRGLAALGESVRERGTAMGIWIEAEAVGVDAELNRLKPQILARRDDDPPAFPTDTSDPGWLGYVCMGSPEGRDHVRASIERLLDRTGARWIKLDFNLDPGAGCSRTDHGHDAGDGLYEHYRGLYSVLDAVRSSRPELLVESCSSGGLRIDLGILSHLHCSFLSDPDWTEFQLQLLWGASQMLPSPAILHFSESQWRTYHPLQNYEPDQQGLPAFDAAMRAVMLHRFAVSYKLRDFSPGLRQRLVEHLGVYREHAAPLISGRAVIRPITAQPLREGHGERFPAFQLGEGPRALVAAFRLHGADGATVLRPRELDPDAEYDVALLGPDADASDLPAAGRARGSELMKDGLHLKANSPASSWLLSITRTDAA
jgi:alpha-galactosidase